MANRCPIQATAGPSVLNEAVIFPVSKKTAKNRIIKVALTEQMSSYDENDLQKTGLPTQKLMNVYSKWGVGGFGMIYTGNIMVDPKHMETRGNSIIHPTLSSPERKDAFKKSVDAMKNDGSLAIAQLNHAGGLTPIEFNPHPYVPSAMKYTSMKSFSFEYGTSAALTTDQIQSEIIQNFVYAAKYCYEVGFDGIELHAAYSYLLSSFLSSKTNKRTDEYGGSIENRTRIVKEIFEGIRKDIPAETGFIVGVKMNTWEFQDCEDFDDDIVKICQELNKIGFDFIQLTGGSCENWYLNPSKLPETTLKREEFFQNQYKKIKPVVMNARIILTGGFKTLHGMTQVINHGYCDLVGLGKATMGEPDVAKKLLSGQYQSVVHNHFSGNYEHYMKSCKKQMTDAASTTLEECNGDVTYGITDFSDEKIAEEYKKKAQEEHEREKLKAQSQAA